MPVATRKEARTTKSTAARALVGSRKSAIEVRKLRTELGLPRRRFAQLVGRTERAVIDWEQGKSRPQMGSQRDIHELSRLTRALCELMKREAIAAWLTTPNRKFNGAKPVELIERGESDLLWQMIFRLRSGVHS